MCLQEKHRCVLIGRELQVPADKGLLWPDTCYHRIPFMVTPAALVSLVGEKGLGFSSLVACCVIPRALVGREERKSREEQEEIELYHLL